jgi:protein-L-isoaspartate(D-aspartate) O-methyltransferase
MMDLDLRRRFFAEELEAVANIRSAGLVDGFAAVPRERFLPAGPWTVLGDAADFLGGGAPRTRATPDADPARVYHNLAIAIDAERQLFNGQPGTLAGWLDGLDLAPGAHVLHVGSGPGYYTAVMAHTVGSTGRVLAFEADARLADAARRNLASMRWVEVRHGDASGAIEGAFDAILVNAGVTHPLESWLDALTVGGRPDRHDAGHGPPDRKGPCVAAVQDRRAQPVDARPGRRRDLLGCRRARRSNQCPPRAGADGRTGPLGGDQAPAARPA